MEDVTNIHIGPLPADSPYVKPFRLHFQQDGKERFWELIKAHDDIAVIVFNTTRKKLVVVKQFRPAVYYGQICEYLKSFQPGTPVDSAILAAKFPPRNAITRELCAGICDKDLPLNEIAREELIEECGYDVSADRLEEVIRFRAGVGTSGNLTVLFYCEVTDVDKVSGAGGGVDEELIDVEELSIEEAEALLKPDIEHISPNDFFLGILWFLTNKAQKFKT